MELIVYKSANQLSKIEIPSDELLVGTELYIGRSDECHIVIDDQLISRHHAVITIEEDNISLKKLTQFGEVILNGSVIEKKSELKIHDRIKISDYIIEISKFDQLSNISTKVEEADENATEILATPLVQEEKSEKAPDEIVDENIESDEDNFEAMNDDSSSDTFDIEENDLGGNDQELSAEEDNFSSNDEFNNDGFSDEGFDSDEGFSDDGFSDDGFSDDSFGSDEDSSEKTQVFQTFASYALKIFGELAPFDNFNIEETEIFIGRDPEKCQIVLNDPEVSSVHAKIHKSMINCVLEDLNSANGTILNGNRINKSELVNGDEFLIGETSFTVMIKSDLIEAEKDVLMPVADNQEVEVVEEVEEEVDFDELSEGDEFSGNSEERPKSIIAQIMKDPKKKRIAIYGTVALLLFYLLSGSEEPSSKEKSSKKNSVKTADGKLKKNQEDKKVQKKDLSPEVLEKLEQLYALALAKYEDGKYSEAKYSLDEIKSIDPNYKDTQTLLKLVNQGYEELERLKKEERAEQERQQRNLIIKKLVEKAKAAVEKREVEVSRNYFSQILAKDPENIDVPQLKMIIDAYVKEKEEKRLAQEKAKAERQKMVDALSPSKTLFLKEDWYNAIGKLEKFIKLEGIDEDLIEEATDMLKTSRRKLSAIVNPMLGKARSFKEGQDLKKAYELYGEILKSDPSNEEAIIERQDIKELLDLRSRRVYREALISESLSLFDEAKEKFQEVQQISPIGSEYYVKASKKLKNYLE